MASVNRLVAGFAKFCFLALGLVCSLVLGALASASEHAAFVGSQACAGCHQEEFKAWQGSHHHQAMAVASPDSVLADFSNVTFDDGDQSARFYQRGGRYFVETVGPEGEAASFRVAYAFGIDPLQQYLVELPDGRLQALTIAWDTRDGSGRWFNLRPGEDNPPASSLHWTGSAYTSNAMCIECHATAFEKHYDRLSDTYASQWQEAGVGCESCHGPGSAHESMMTSGADPAADYGFDHRFSRNHWTRQEGAAIAVPGARSQSELMLDVCGPCHSRRATLSEPGRPGESLFDHYRPSLLDEGLYYADGQIRDEVFVWGSFTQSRMHAAGVTCNDCHDPHGMGLRAQGDALCSGCHSPDIYAAAEHSFHETSDVSCVDCHMPATTYMEIDPRRDHRFGLPRPDLSEQLDLPNACSNCHEDVPLKQLAGAIRDARGEGWKPRPLVASDLQAYRQGRRTPALARWASSKGLSPIARATLIADIGAAPLPADRALLAAAHRDADPLVRIAALSTLPARLDADSVRFALESLSDERKSVRIEAVRALLFVPAQVVGERYREAHAEASAEYEKTLLLNSDQAQSLVALAELRASAGQLDLAHVAFEQAMSRHPYFLPAYANAADLRRQSGDEKGAEKALRRGLSVLPDAPALHYAMGLLHVRARNLDRAMPALANAVRFSDSAPSYAYTYAIALEASGDVAGAIKVLEDSLKGAPGAARLAELLAMYRAKQAEQE